MHVWTSDKSKGDLMLSSGLWVELTEAFLAQFTLGPGREFGAALVVLELDRGSKLVHL